MSHEERMRPAIDEAVAAAAAGEVPVGAVIYMDGKIIARGRNRRVELGLATAHAEILAIDEACRALGDWRLEGAELYVTAEPCFMCAGAVLQARIPKIVYGVRESKFGAIVSNASVFDISSLNHHPEYIGGVCEAEISAIMKEFFRRIRIY